MPPPESNMEITNYDVLADEVTTPISADESDIGLSLAAHSYHVGNNRLEVLCSIHNKAYSDHEAKGDESNSTSIVEKIMDIVQNQCMPKGRFLQRDQNGEWKVVDDNKAKLLIRQALSQVTRQNEDNALLGGEASEGDEKAKDETDAEKKRRRRSSLLRRSVSSSMLPTMVGGKLDGKPFDDKKKAIRKALEIGSDDASSPDNSPIPSRSNSPTPADKEKKETSALPGYGRSQTVQVGSVSGVRAVRRLGIVNADRRPLIKKTQTMDILFNTGKTVLLPDTDLHGNNRLRVMITLQSTAYKEADEEGKKKMAQDLASTIEDFWGGRILSQVPGRRSRNGGGTNEEAYVELDKENSISALQLLLSGKEGEEEDDNGDDGTEAKQGRRASLKAIQSLGSASSGSFSSILPSNLPTLPNDMQHLRSQAVKSLQKRKQRQGLNSKIRDLTANKAAIFQDGSSNASVVSSNMTTTAGSVAPPMVVAPLPTTVTSSQQNNFRHYRQTSSETSVASTVTQMSAGPGMQRQSSLGGMSTASSNTSMSMNTVNAARAISSINLRQPQNMQSAGGQFQQNLAQASAGTGNLSDYDVPPNITTSGPAHQYQQQYLGMPSVPEDYNGQNYNGQGYPNVETHLNHLNQQFENDGRPSDATDRNSLLNYTGSDGLPQFGQGEVDMLIKGLDMAEQQQQQEQQHREQQYQQQQHRFD